MKKTILRFLGYLAYTILIGYLFSECTQYERHLQKIVASETYQSLPLLVFKTTFPIFLGILMALPQFYKLWISNKVGLCFDWVKFTAIGIPTFLVAILPLAYFYPPGLGKFLYFFHSLLIPSTIGGIIFGHLLLSSFKKRDSV